MKLIGVMIATLLFFNATTEACVEFTSHDTYTVDEYGVVR